MIFTVLERKSRGDGFFFTKFIIKETFSEWFHAVSLGSETLLKRIQRVFMEANCALIPWHLFFKITFLHCQIDLWYYQAFTCHITGENYKISKAFSINEEDCCQLHMTSLGVPTPSPTLLLKGLKGSIFPYICNPFQLHFWGKGKQKVDCLIHKETTLRFGTSALQQ